MLVQHCSAQKHNSSVSVRRETRAFLINFSSLANMCNFYHFRTFYKCVAASFVPNLDLTMMIVIEPLDKYYMAMHYILKGKMASQMTKTDKNIEKRRETSKKNSSQEFRRRKIEQMFKKTLFLSSFCCAHIFSHLVSNARDVCVWQHTSNMCNAVFSFDFFCFFFHWLRTHWNLFSSCFWPNIHLQKQLWQTIHLIHICARFAFYFFNIIL